jgi:hypothetical protein
MYGVFFWYSGMMPVSTRAFEIREFCQRVRAASGLMLPHAGQRKSRAPRMLFFRFVCQRVRAMSGLMLPHAGQGTTTPGACLPVCFFADSVLK